MQLTPAYLTSVASFYDMLEIRPRPGTTTCSCARTSRARCSAPTSSSMRWSRPRQGRRRQRGVVRVPGRVRHRAHGLGQRGVRGAARARRRRADRRGPPRRDARSCPRSRSATAARWTPVPSARRSRSGVRHARPPTATPTRWVRSHEAETARGRRRRSRSPETGEKADAEDPLRQDRRAGAEHAGGLRAPRRLSVAAQGAEHAARGRALPADGRQHPRPRRRRLPDGQEGLVPAPGRHGQVPGLQRRRVRAGDLQGPRADAEEPAHADRGHRHRRLRRRHRPRLHLHPGRVPAAGRHPRGGDRRGGAGRLHRREHPRQRGRRCRWSCTAAPAPTSAARRPACWTRWRASAATRA